MPHEFDNVTWREWLEFNSIPPTYWFEFSVTVPIGQFRIRAEALFTEDTGRITTLAPESGGKMAAEKTSETRPLQCRGRAKEFGTKYY